VLEPLRSKHLAVAVVVAADKQDCIVCSDSGVATKATVENNRARDALERVVGVA
jgi:hypothetical protein